MDIGAWLRNLGLERYEAAFRDNEIDAEVLPTLTAEDLKDLGVTVIGHRRKLLNAIAALAEAAEPAPGPQTEAGEGAKASARARPAEAERRQLTVMFVDLVGSTELSARLDPEDMREVIRAYQDACAGVITRFEGFVAKFMGDGVLAYFGYPRAHEDEAERAVRAGLALAATVGGLSVRDGEALAARIGIATGLVVVGDLVGEGAAREQAVVGDTPNLAARLQGIAPPGQVVIADATRRLLGAGFALEDLGERELKGISEPVPAFAVTGERPVESRFEAMSGPTLLPMVGRDQELALLLERWARAKAGEGQGVLLVGEAGIGKSRISHALLDVLADEPHLRVRYQCSPYHGDSALWPVIRQLNHAAGLGAEDPLEVRLDKLEALLERAGGRDAAPLIADLLGLDGATRYGPLSLTPQGQRARTLRALTEQLLGLAARQSVLVVLEDAHWIDPTTLELIEQCLDRIADAGVLLLLTSRPDRQPKIAAHPHVTRLALNRLGRGGVEAIVARLGGDHLPAETIDAIIARTDGVPLFVEELTKAILETGEASIPASLHDLLMARLDRIPEVKEVAQTAACIGREFSYKLLAAVSSLADNELGDALGRLINAELIFQRGRPPDATYSFKHALVQDAAYESLLKSRRRWLHAAFGRALESEVGSPVEAGLDVIAEHFAKGAVWPKAMEFYRRAAEGARRRHAIKEGLALYDQALAAGGHLDAREAADSLMSIYQARSELYFAIGSFEQSRAENARMLDIARSVGNRDRESIALAGMAWAGMWAEDFPSALAHAREAIEVAEAVGCQAALGNAHMTTGFVQAVSGRLDRAGEALSKTLTICRPAGDVLRESLSLYMSCHIENWRGQFDRAIELASAGAAIAREHNLISAFLRNTYAQGLSLVGKGQYDQALTLLTEGLALAEKIGDEAFLPRYLNGLGWLHIECEDLERGIAFSNRCTEITRRQYHAVNVEMTSFAEVNIGDAVLATGDLKQAQEILDSVHRTVQNPATTEWMKWRYSTHLFASLGRLCLSRGDPRRAREFADQCLKIAVPTGSRKYIISAWMLLGAAAFAQGDQADAEKWLRQALKLARAIRHPPQLWRTHLALSQLYAETKRDRLARRQRMAALAVVEKIKRSTTAPDLQNGLESSPRLRQVYELAGER